MDKDKIVDQLNGLIEICKDGQEGFRQAAEKVVSPDLKLYFNEESLIRSRMKGDLQAEVVRLGSNPDTQGTVAGALHRTWFDFKSAIGVSDHSILASVENGEDAAVNAFEKALKEPLPGDLLQLIERQYLSVKATHDRVKALRDADQYKTKTA